MASTYTSKLNLEKPDGDDDISVLAINGNSDKIEAFAGNLITENHGAVSSLSGLSTILDNILINLASNQMKAFQINFTTDVLPFKAATYLCMLYKSGTNTTYSHATFRRVDESAVVIGTRNSNGWGNWNMIAGRAQVRNITSQTNITSGAIYIVSLNNIRQMVVVDAVLPASDAYLTLPQMTSQDQPTVSTEGMLRRYDGSLLYIWLRASGTWGQSNGKQGATLNGNLVWLVG